MVEQQHQHGRAFHSPMGHRGTRHAEAARSEARRVKGQEQQHRSQVGQEQQHRSQVFRWPTGPVALFLLVGIVCVSTGK